MAISQIDSSGIAAGAISGSLVANGSITSAHVDVSANGTGAISVPSGTTAQRPAATQGYIRYNTTLGTLESANGTAWANVGSGSASSSSSSAANLTSLTGNVYISAAGGIIDASNVSGGLIIPTGTYNQRPSNAANGTIRWNSSNTQLEVYVAGNTGWYTLASTTYLIEVLAVAGGGGGGGLNGTGGGGAGGVLSLATSVSPGISYGVVIGAGGSGITHPTQGNSGTNSTFGSLATAFGGGYGQTQGVGSSGGNGGSGGGSCGGGGSGTSGGTAGSGTTGQGNPGGLGWFNNANDGGGGGGGAGGSGSNAGNNSGGPGGIGTNSFSAWTTATGTGVSNYLAGGGGGGSYNGPVGSGGTGGGGSGSTGNPTGSAGSGTANSGGGGGGAYYSGSGGSGLILVRYLGSQRGFGGTISSSGGYTYHKFTSSGTFIA